MSFQLTSLSVDKLVLFRITRQAKQNVRFGIFVREDSRGGGVGKKAWVGHQIYKSGGTKVYSTHQVIIIRNDERTCGRTNMTLVNTGQISENEPAGSR